MGQLGRGQWVNMMRELASTQEPSMTACAAFAVCVSEPGARRGSGDKE